MSLRRAEAGSVGSDEPGRVPRADGGGVGAVMFPWPDWYTGRAGMAGSSVSSVLPRRQQPT
jgi:hypothetical protein